MDNVTVLAGIRPLDHVKGYESRQPCQEGQFTSKYLQQIRRMESICKVMQARTGLNN